MNVLVIAPYYPYPDYPSWGIFNERTACALSEFCERVEVLAPRPYAPPIVSSLVSRWKSYSQIAGYEVRNGIRVYRPRYIQIPRLGLALCADPGAFFCCRPTARDMHRRARFNAIISFDLVASGGLAWRIGQDLRIPASGWAIGNDVRVPASSSHEGVLLRAIERLDLVFYQSHELLEIVARRLGIPVAQMSEDRHVVLSRGICPPPPLLPRRQLRNQVRQELRIAADAIMVLNVGRIVRAKGVFELLESVSLATTVNPKIVCVLVGSKPAFDDTTSVMKRLNEATDLRQRIRLVPNCSPDKVWEYLCAADIFAFTSHKEGMPNSLLEAMAMEVPAVAFAIPSVLEIEAATGCIVMVPPLNCARFAGAIVRLAASSDDRASIGKKGRIRAMENFMIREKMAEALGRLAQVVEKRVS
jgi:teichuronic acid biosynthesis glycosyltransferase TuaC